MSESNSKGPLISAREIARALGTPPPTEEQGAIIEASATDPLLVVAGAGSGKTETMAARVVWLVANKFVAPERILGLTFTRKAAGELAVRIRTRLKQLREAGLFDDGLLPHERALATPTISTYNAYAARLVSEHALRLGVEPDAVTLSEAGQWQLAYDIVHSWPDDLKLTCAESVAIAAVLDLAGECAEHLIEPAQVAQYFTESADALEALGAEKRLRNSEREYLDRWRERVNLIPVVEAYIERKRANNLLDFADQISLIANLVTQDPQIGERERERFGAVLLDEYQDTSHAQVAFLAGLFGAGHPVTAVGDPLQAIYGWRGASAGALLRFPHTFHAVDEVTGAKTPAASTNLTVAWRNDRAILQAANKTAAPLVQGAMSGQSHGASVKELRPRPDAGPGKVTAQFLETTEQEARAIAEFMAHQRGTNAAPTAQPVSAAVLCRTRAQFDAILEALIEADVPAEVVGLSGLLDTPEVSDVVATLQAMHNPDRGDGLMRLLTNPRWNLGIRDLRALARWSEKLVEGDRDQRSIIDGLDDLSNRKTWPRNELNISEEGQQRLTQLGQQLRQLRSRTGLRLQDLVAEVERMLLFDIEFAIDPVRSAQSRHHLEQFREVAARYEATGGTGAPVTLGGFLDWLEVASSRERGLPVTSVNPSADAVQLLTIHAAKGLEWDVVAVSGLNEGTFPSCTAPKDPTKPVKYSAWLRDYGAVPFDLRGDADSLPEFLGHSATDPDQFRDLVEEFRVIAGQYLVDEERRLAYVAFTRARRALLLTGAWWKDDRKNAARPSRFIAELVRAGAADGGWDPDPVNETNPMDEMQRTAQWPPDHTGHIHPRLIPTADRVRELIANQSEAALSIDQPETEEIATWYRHADLLVAEAQLAAAPEREIALPTHLSASALVALTQDAPAFALMRRRPVPVQPTPRSRLGTAFHTWVEQLYGTPTLVDLDDLPGEQMQLDDDLDALKEAFTASQWAQRQPIALEIDIDTPVADTTIRCRIDAVFEEPDGTVLIVDWKTGQPPAIGSDAHRQRSLQLAVYRLAWARLYDVNIDDIKAIFVHVAPHKITEVESVDLSDQEIAQMLATSAPNGRLEFA